MTLTYQDGFARPPDVPAFVPQTVSYPSGTNPHIVGDGTGTRGSPMPVLALQLDDIPSTATGWILPADDSFPPPTLAVGEAKFRAHLGVSHILPDDPIRNYGQPGASHLHQFFGNVTTNAFSTYASLRNRANERAARGQVATTSSGGPYNASGYWVPAMMNNGSVVKMGGTALYYTSNPLSRSAKAQRLPRGLRYVTGFNMDDPDDLIVKARIAAANAQSGTAGRYVYSSNGFLGWTMFTPDLGAVIQTAGGSDFSPCIVNLDGSNPWEGMGVTAGCWLRMTINGPAGCDGHNLWSPGGYQHTYHTIYDTYLGEDCLPQGAFWLPQLELYPFFQHQGWEDYRHWYLSSDAHGSMVAGRTLAPGTTAHADWIGAWDDSVFGTATGWQGECVGVIDGATLRNCGSGAFRADGMRLIEAEPAPDGTRNPQAATEFYNTSVPGDMFAVPTSFSGPVTVPARAS